MTEISFAQIQKLETDLAEQIKINSELQNRLDKQQVQAEATKAAMELKIIDLKTEFEGKIADAVVSVKVAK